MDELVLKKLTLNQVSEWVKDSIQFNYKILKNHVLCLKTTENKNIWEVWLMKSKFNKFINCYKRVYYKPMLIDYKKIIIDKIKYNYDIECDSENSENEIKIIASQNLIKLLKKMKD